MKKIRPIATKITNKETFTKNEKRWGNDLVTVIQQPVYLFNILTNRYPSIFEGKSISLFVALNRKLFDEGGWYPIVAESMGYEGHIKMVLNKKKVTEINTKFPIPESSKVSFAVEKTNFDDDFWLKQNSENKSDVYLALDLSPGDLDFFSSIIVPTYTDGKIILTSKSYPVALAYQKIALYHGLTGTKITHLVQGDKYYTDVFELELHHPNEPQLNNESENDFLIKKALEIMKNITNARNLTSKEILSNEEEELEYWENLVGESFSLENGDFIILPKIEAVSITTGEIFKLNLNNNKNIELNATNKKLSPNIMHRLVLKQDKSEIVELLYTLAFNYE